jgi:hypothetical protein
MYQVVGSLVACILAAAATTMWLPHTLGLDCLFWVLSLQSLLPDMLPACLHLGLPRSALVKLAERQGETAAAAAV